MVLTKYKIFEITNNKLNLKVFFINIDYIMFYNFNKLKF